MRHENIKLWSGNAKYCIGPNGLRKCTASREVPDCTSYDLVVFCDLGKEPPWVIDQVRFVQTACEDAGIRFEVLTSPLYQDYLRDFGNRRVVSIPFWTLDLDGKKGK